jgi:hypothetical protein
MFAADGRHAAQTNKRVFWRAVATANGRPIEPHKCQVPFAFCSRAMQTRATYVDITLLRLIAAEEKQVSLVAMGCRRRGPFGHGRARKIGTNRSVRPSMQACKAKRTNARILPSSSIGIALLNMYTNLVFALR